MGSVGQPVSSTAFARFMRTGSHFFPPAFTLTELAQTSDLMLVSSSLEHRPPFKPLVMKMNSLTFRADHSITTLTTLSSILQHSLRWRDEGEEDNNRGCIRGISRIDIAAGVTLSMGESATDILFRPSQSSRLTVTMRNAERDAARPARVKASISAIRQMRLSPESTTALSHVLFRDPNPISADYEVWVAEVSLNTGTINFGQMAYKWLSIGATMVDLQPRIGGLGPSAVATVRGQSTT